MQNTYVLADVNLVHKNRILLIFRKEIQFLWVNF